MMFNKDMLLFAYGASSFPRPIGHFSALLSHTHIIQDAPKESRQDVGIFRYNRSKFGGRLWKRIG
jgi:hypothetical protein